MIQQRIENFPSGWFIGNFKDSILNTKEFEVCYRIHKQHEPWPAHYHAIATEYNLLISGEMNMTAYRSGEGSGPNHRLVSGDIFIMEPGEWAAPFFITDCEILTIKVPSIPGDKYTS